MPGSSHTDEPLLASTTEVVRTLKKIKNLAAAGPHNIPPWALKVDLCVTESSTTMEGIWKSCLKRRILAFVINIARSYPVLFYCQKSILPHYFWKAENALDKQLRRKQSVNKNSPMNGRLSIRTPWNTVPCKWSENLLKKSPTFLYFASDEPIVGASVTKVSNSDE